MNLVVVDFGSQYTGLITKKLHSLGYDASLVTPEEVDQLNSSMIAGFVLSGGPETVGLIDSPEISQKVFDMGKPILGICYGMQLVVDKFGGKFSSSKPEFAEFGQAVVEWSDIPGWKTRLSSKVWMSHNDHLVKMPDGFLVWGKSQNGSIAALKHSSKPIFAVQFHPEVEHSECGDSLFSEFSNVCGLVANSRNAKWVSDATSMIQSATSSGGNCLVAVSGGVDSTVAAALVKNAIGPERVLAICIDHGLAREQDIPDVKQVFEHLGIQLTILNEKERFLKALAGLTDPEDKRKAIGKAFIEAFENSLKHTQRDDVKYLVQGTLASDLIE